VPVIEPSLDPSPTDLAPRATPLPLEWMRRAALPVLFAALVAAGGFIRLHVPGNPIPFTLQVSFVLLAGAVLRPRAAFSSMALFVGGGLLGAPVFSGGAAGLAHLLGPSGGYLVGFLAAAPLEAWLLRRPHPGFLRACGAMAAAVLVIHMLGALHLTLFLGGAFGTALSATAQFLPLDLVKIAGVAALVAGTGSWIRRAQPGS